MDVHLPLQMIDGCVMQLLFHELFAGPVLALSSLCQLAGPPFLSQDPATVIVLLSLLNKVAP